MSHLCTLRHSIVLTVIRVNVMCDSVFMLRRVFGLHALSVKHLLMPASEKERVDSGTACEIASLYQRIGTEYTAERVPILRQCEIKADWSTSGLCTHSMTN